VQRLDPLEERLGTAEATHRSATNGVDQDAMEQRLRTAELTLSGLKDAVEDNVLQDMASLHGVSS
jgi:hypothetical protein